MALKGSDLSLVTVTQTLEALPGVDSVHLHEIRCGVELHRWGPDHWQATRCDLDVYSPVHVPYAECEAHGGCDRPSEHHEFVAGAVLMEIRVATKVVDLPKA